MGYYLYNYIYDIMYNIYINRGYKIYNIYKQGY